MRFKTLFEHLGDWVGKEVVLEGWVRSSRIMKNRAFLSLSDGSTQTFIQVVCEQTLFNEEDIQKASIGSAVQVKGVLVATPNAKQAFECVASDLLIIGEAPENYPLQKKRHSLDYLRTQAHLRPRTNLFSAVFRMRSVMQFAIHQFFMDRDFVCLHPSILTATDAEGAGELFQVTHFDLNQLPLRQQGDVDYGQDFFGKKTSLSVSGQLNAEAFAMSFKDVYTFSPTFRAENSHTPRHAAEFWMVEPEIAFADLEDLMDLAESFVQFLASKALEELPEEMKFFDEYVEPGVVERLEKVKMASFARMTYTQAIEHLMTSGRKFDYAVTWGIDLQTEHERYLTDELVKGPVFVTDYPKEIKAFYMRLNDDGKTVKAVDLLVPGIGELIGGSQREDRFDLLEQRMEALGMDKESYQWYLDLRRFGGVPHAGFGLGFERLLMYVSGVKNIRDVIAFPRVPGNISF